MHRFTITMTTLALALGFQPGHAAAPPGAPSMVVHFADLDLSRIEGASVLYQRLKVAADTVCAPLDDRPLAMHMTYTECVQTAIRAAVAKVDRPVLTAYYEGKTNRRNATLQVAQK